MSVVSKDRDISRFTPKICCHKVAEIFRIQTIDRKIDKYADDFIEKAAKPKLFLVKTLLATTALLFTLGGSYYFLHKLRCKI